MASLMNWGVGWRETGDNFYFVFKRSRAHEPAISRLRQWLWQESQASLRPGENEPLRRV